MSKSRDKGTRAETLVVAHVRKQYWPLAERRTLNGGADKGDLNVHPNLVIEVKSCKTYSFPAWMRETETERRNADAAYGILIVKPNGVGATQVGNWWAVLTLHAYNELCGESIAHGYGPWVPMPIPKWQRFEPAVWLWAAPVITYKARGVSEWYAVMKLDTALELLAYAGLGTEGKVT